jgi:hypothetical protein
VKSTTRARRGAQRDPRAARDAAQPNALAAASSPYVVLTANSLDARGLTYTGTFDLSQPSGTVQVLRFTMTSGSLAGMSFSQPCVDAMTTVTAADSASLGNTTFDAVRLVATVGGTPVTFTAANPPSTEFPSEIVLQDMTLTLTTVSADTLDASSLAVQTATC